MSPASWSFVSPDAKRGRSLAIIYAIVALDAAGIGLVFPILPRLILEVTHSPDVAPYVGWMAALYAVMQFVLAPILGAMSDRLGRRPVLLVSLVGAAINYVVMALTPQFWMLMLGRAVGGLTSANMSVATAYITDITPGEQRARRFGLMGAMFGAGFIIGPVLGGVLGEQWVRLPFVAAAALIAGNLLLALFALPESHTPSSVAWIDLAALNPLRPLRWLVSMPSLLPLVVVYFALSGAGEAYGICWALWGYDAFGWNGFWVGLSLGAFGVWQTLVQAVAAGACNQASGPARCRPDRDRLLLRRSPRDGVCVARLGRLRDHADIRAGQHWNAGIAGARDRAGQRRPAGATAGIAGVFGEFGFDYRAAWLLQLLLRGSATMAWCRLACRPGRQPAGRAVRAARHRAPSHRRSAMTNQQTPRQHRCVRHADRPAQQPIRDPAPEG